MGAMRKNAKKKAQQRAGAEKSRAQRPAIVEALRRVNATDPQRPLRARAT